jgi:MFS family permease
MSQTSADVPAAVSPFAPFQHRAFALLWTATLISNIGTWMHDVSAAWLMTSLSPSPFVVALVQAATTAAMALFALPAGAMADLLDRRKLLMVLTTVKFLLALLLGIVSWLGLIDVWGLLLVTFLLGTASAFLAPVWQATVPSLVPRPTLKAAVALNSAGMNVARAIGPTLGGIIIVSAGVGTAFLLNAASELVIFAALLLWSPAVRKSAQAPENFLPAIVAGVRYATHSPELKVVLWRSAGFFLFASAFWALIPLIVRNVLQADASVYGLMVGAVGFGAVAGALLLPRVDKQLGPNRLVMAGSVGMACVLVTLALVPVKAAALVACLVSGLSWIFVLSSLNVAAQNALPDWVRGRGLSIYGMVFFGSMTLGALFWGAAASLAGVLTALLLAAIGMIFGIWVTRSKTLLSSTSDLNPAGHWPEPVLALPVENDVGPVMVCIDYRIDPARSAEFVAVLNRLADERRRDGAYQWGVMRDAADPALFTEYFLVASWVEHERQHGRVTKADADLQAEARAFHLGPESPAVRHLLATTG